MLSHPKDTHWYPVFYVMANTGMRVGEITGLRWSDIDLKKGIIRVNHTLVYYNHRDEKGCYFSINTPKTKAGEREIPMTEGVKQAFLMEREFQSQAEISSKSRVDGYDDFIFVNRYGDVQNQGNLNKALRRMMRDCNDEILEKYGADPHLLSEWDYEKNSKWTPSNVSRNSMKVVWWKCGAGHSYRAKITDRTIEQKGCPQCEAEFQQALPQMLIMMYGAQNGITVKSNSDSELGMRLVAYLPELHCAVDIAGATVTEKREQSVKAHICQSNRLGYYLIKRTADASQMAAEIKTLFIRNHIYLHTDSEKDVQVLRERFLEWKYRNACKLNGKY